MKRARINLSLENDLLDWLEAEAKEKRTSVSQIVRELVAKEMATAAKQATAAKTLPPYSITPGGTNSLLTVSRGFGVNDAPEPPQEKPNGAARETVLATQGIDYREKRK